MDDDDEPKTRPDDEMLSTNAVLARLRSLVADDMSHTDTVNCVFVWIEELEQGKPTR